MIELKVTHKTHNIQPQHGRQNARQRQLHQLGRQQQISGSASRSASSKHGRRRPEQPRFGASVDGEARQETALTVRPRRRTRRRSLVPSHAMSSYSVERCHWRRRVDSAPRRPPNNGTQHTARGSSQTSLSSSERLDCSKSVVELYCSKSIVELRGTVDNNSPARNSRAHANCSVLSLTRMFLRETTTPQTERNCSVAQVIS